MDRYLAFLKVLEQGSFTKAADALGYSQSAVSQMIQSLEAELELTLLHRGHRGVKLSPEGESLLPYIQSAVNHYNAMLEAVRDMKQLEGGLIRIGTLSSYSSQWLPPLIRSLRRCTPRCVSCSIRVTTPPSPNGYATVKLTLALSTPMPPVWQAWTPF